MLAGDRGEPVGVGAGTSSDSRWRSANASFAPGSDQPASAFAQTDDG